MIGYVTLGTNDMEKSRLFFDALFSDIGAKRVFEDEDHMTLWGYDLGQPLVGVVVPNDGNAATIGNGTMPALVVKDADAVKQLHAKALALGATDEGAPGPRGFGKAEFGYFRIPEGHKFAVFCTGM